MLSCIQTNSEIRGEVQADVLFKPFVKAMIDETRKFFPWVKEMEPLIAALPGPTKKKDKAIRSLMLDKIEMIDEMENMLNKLD